MLAERTLDRVVSVRFRKDVADGRQAPYEEWCKIDALRAEVLSLSEIARRLGRSQTTISREVARNSDVGEYCPDEA